MFEIVINVTFQSIFYLEMHQNNIYFHFLKFIFDISIKTIQIHQKKFNLKQKN
jgi:hypothetical protein